LARADEQALLEGLVSGDPAATERLWEWSRPFVERILRTFASSREHAEDMLQDFYAEYFFGPRLRDLAAWRQECGLRTWLSMHAGQFGRRTRKWAARRAGVSASLDDLGLSWDDVSARADELSFEWGVHIERCLELLTERARRALLLAAEGNALYDIAREIGTAHNSVGPLLTRARRSIAQCIDGGDADG